MLRSLLSRIGKKDDPYEDFFLNAVPADPRNLIVNRLREAPDGSVYAIKAETHTPEVMSEHVREMGRFFGADEVRIVSTCGLGLPTVDELPFALFTLFRSEHDPRDATGIGGQVAALKGAFATFQVGAIVRELGFEARRVTPEDPDATAAAAGLGSLDERGRLKTPRFGTAVYVADVLVTNLPLRAD